MAGGLIQNALPGTNTTAAPDAGNVVNATSVGIDPAQRTVDPAKETVSGQLNTLLGKDSPYLQQARAGALDTANGRGLLNSSMAAGAGESAAIGAALPIASQDANTYSGASATNTASTNAALAQNADAANKTSLTNAAAGNEEALQQLKGTQATGLAQIEAKYKGQMQASASAASTFQETAKAITAILNDPNTSTVQKQNAVNNQTSLLQSAMAVIGGVSGLNLQGLLDFSGTAA